jgi:tRNA A-37 threonylcarbamoyl transferase component Bud32
MGVLLKKLLLEANSVDPLEREREREHFNTLFRLAVLKLAFYMYHPTDRIHVMYHITKLPFVAQRGMTLALYPEVDDNLQSVDVLFSPPPARKILDQENESTDEFGESDLEKMQGLDNDDSMNGNRRSWFRQQASNFLDRISPINEKENWFETSYEKAPMESNPFGLSNLDALYADTDLPRIYWQVNELIGHGASGLVYRAKLYPKVKKHQVERSVIVAVKHFNLPQVNPHLNQQNHEHLIAVLSFADHPNVMSFYGSCIREDRCFVFMEYCDGGTLEDYVREKGPLRDENLLISWIRQLLLGVDFLHKSSVIHRDLVRHLIYTKLKRVFGRKDSLEIKFVTIANSSLFFFLIP